MCMLASRYSDDPNNPVTAGYHYFGLFRRLRDLCATGDNVVFSIQSLFFASQFHCV